jgi:PTH1 family peptidyl-tRNA hydrolase
MVVEEVARRHGLRFAKGQGNSEVAKGSILGSPVVLAKPLTYMNNSGMAVGAVSRFYRVPIERILVVYDEIALPLGTLRLREKGSSAGHNGIKSLIHHLGTQNFPRLRVGVDQPPPGRHSQVDWVLSRFSPDEQKIMDETIPRAADAIEAVLRDGIERAMNFYNAKESNAPVSKSSKPIGVRQESGVRSQELEGEGQGEVGASPAIRVKAEKPDTWVDRVRRIVRGEQEAR